MPYCILDYNCSERGMSSLIFTVNIKILSAVASILTCVWVLNNFKMSSLYYVKEAEENHFPLEIKIPSVSGYMRSLTLYSVLVHPSWEREQKTK